MDTPKMKYAAFSAKIDVDRGERTVVAAISTDTKDRDGEVLLPKGVDLKQYRKNPVVLWAHDYSQPPVGKALWIKKDGNKVVAKIKFANTDFANQIFDLFDGGFLSAWSVGFIPTAGHEPTEKELAERPDWEGVRKVYDKWELLESSAVPVPSNPSALALAVSKGLKVPKELLEQAEDTIEMGVIDSESEEAASHVWPVDLTPVADGEADTSGTITVADPDVETKISVVEPEGPQVDADRVMAEALGITLEDVEQIKYGKIREHEAASTESEAITVLGVTPDEAQATVSTPIVLTPPKRPEPKPIAVLDSDEEIRKRQEAKAQGVVTWEED